MPPEPIDFDAGMEDAGGGNVSLYGVPPVPLDAGPPTDDPDGAVVSAYGAPVPSP